MQISGIREFAQNISQTTSRHHISLPVPQGIRQAFDTVDISEIGKRLSANIQKTAQPEETDRTKILTEAEKNIDKAMKKAQGILERMKELAVLAQDKSLGDLDRIEIQIEIEDLRDNLVMIPDNLMTGKNQSREQRDKWFLELRNFGYGSTYGDGSTLLQRARERALNGEKWDVREAWRSDTEIFVSHDEDGNEVWKVKTPGWYVIDEDQNITMQDLDGQYIQTGKKVPTVRERLEAQTQYIVMDSESAEKSAELMQKQIDFISKWREEMPARIEAVKDDEEARDAIMQEAYDFLTKTALPGGIYDLSVNAPDIAYIHISGNNIYDRANPSGGLIHKYDENGVEIPLEPSMELDTGKTQEEEGKLYVEASRLSGNLLNGFNNKDIIDGFAPPDVRVIMIEGINRNKH